MHLKTRDKFEIAIICALPLEADAVLALFDEFYDDTVYGKPQEITTSYTTGRIGQHNVVLAHMPGMGKVSAASVASRLLFGFAGIKLALVVGICGGVPFISKKTEVILGDVIISDSIVEYDFGRQYPDGFRKKTGAKDTLPRPNQDIRSYLAKLKTHRIRSQIQEQTYRNLQSTGEWNYPGTSLDVLFAASYRHKHHQPNTSPRCVCNRCKSSTDPVCDDALTSDCSTLRCAGKLIKRDRLSTAEWPHPFVYIGTMASADTVMKSGEHRDKIAEVEGVIGFEMEGAGVWDNIPCVIIKGVCDYADSHKSKIWQDYAALTAASCAKAFLEFYTPTSIEFFSAESQHSQTKVYLRDYYTTTNRLHIQRISGELLPMDQCYINLAVIESSHSTQAISTDQYSPSSLLARLNVETVKMDKQVFLPTIFEPRTKDNKSLVPRRILIRGRAGVGKSTLCKKMVSDYLHHAMWHQLFDLLLWVPLRRLKSRTIEKYTVVDLFHDLYFSELEDGKDLATHLWDMVNSPMNKNKILFILDGLDEVSQEWDSETPMNNILLRLLNQPQVIITSRPYGINLSYLKPFDLELETIGFDSLQVETYVRNILKRDPKRVDGILSFIREHPLIQGLVRIPIQLDAMCYSWDRSFMLDEPKTMTVLYQAITLKLWQKDILRLEKPDPIKHLNEYSIRSLSASKIQNLIPDEIHLIESLAFIGFYNGIIEFNAVDRHRIYDSLRNTLPTASDTTLKKISFLHTSDTLVMDQDRSYHFLHLTFQEYFAARYFVRHWVKRQQLSCLELRQRTPKLVRIDPQNFLQTERFNLHYDILWRFVAGLLQDVAEDEQETKEPVRRFFQELEAEPRDLLGPVHQRILMHCLNEVIPDQEDNLDFRTKIEERVQRWVWFECEVRGTLWLGCERECPESSLKSLMGVMKEYVLGTLHEQQPNLSQPILEVLTSLLKDKDSYISSMAARILSKQPNFPQTILETIVSLLKDEKDPDARLMITEILKKKSDLPQMIPEAVASLLKDEDSRIRSMIIHTLDTSLPQTILKALASLLHDEDISIRFMAADVLERQQDLPQTILEAVISCLDSRDSRTRLMTVQALRKQLNLSQVVLEALVLLLKDKNSSVRTEAIRAMCQLPILLPVILEVLTALSKDENSDVRIGTITAQTLQERSNLSPSIFKGLISYLKDQELKERIETIRVLTRETTLPPVILEALIPLLKDRNSQVRARVVEVLQYQSTLSQKFLEALVPLIEDRQLDINSATAKILRKQSTLPPVILEALVSFLKVRDPRTRLTTIQALEERPDVSQPVLETLCSLLKNKNPHIKLITMEALREKLNLSQSVLEVLVSFLKDADLKVKIEAIQILGRQTTLPIVILKPMVSLLTDRDSDIRSMVAWNLSWQLSLPRVILEDLALLLKDEDSYIRSLAAQPLKRKSLPQVILEDLASLLKDEDSHIRSLASQALEEQEILPQTILETLVLFLRDENPLSMGKLLGRQTTLSKVTLEALVSLLGKEYQEHVKVTAERVLRHQNAFHYVLPNLNAESLTSLYMIWLTRSFEEQMSCYLKDNNLYIDMPEGRKEIPLGKHGAEIFKDAIQEAQRALGVPPWDAPCSESGISVDANEETTWEVDIWESSDEEDQHMKGENELIKPSLRPFWGVPFFGSGFGHRLFS